jgi:hypothetical protein
VVAGDEVWEEDLHEEVVRDGVDVEGEADVLLSRLEDGLAAGNTGVQDQDGWVADLGLDLGLDFKEAGLVGDVALEVVDVGCYGPLESRTFGALGDI